MSDLSSVSSLQSSRQIEHAGHRSLDFVGPYRVAPTTEYGAEIASEQAHAVEEEKTSGVWVNTKNKEGERGEEGLG
jgi:hypothetical protein